MSYQIVSKTTTGTKKLYYESNGDWCKSLDNGNCVVLAVADDTPVEKGGENAGRPPFPFRTAFGILVAQSILGLSDRGICRTLSSRS